MCLNPLQLQYGVAVVGILREASKSFVENNTSYISCFYLLQLFYLFQNCFTCFQKEQSKYKKNKVKTRQLF